MLNFNGKTNKGISGLIVIMAICLIFLSACSDNKKKNTSKGESLTDTPFNNYSDTPETVSQYNTSSEKSAIIQKINSKKVSISLDNQGVVNAFESLSKSSGVKIELTDRLAALNPKITLKLKNISSYSAIKNIARAADLRFRIEDNRVLVDTKY
jgi:hypothetical protein